MNNILRYFYFNNKNHLVTNVTDQLNIVVNYAIACRQAEIDSYNRVNAFRNAPGAFDWRIDQTEIDRSEGKGPQGYNYDQSHIRFHYALMGFLWPLCIYFLLKDQYFITIVHQLFTC